MTNPDPNPTPTPTPPPTPAPAPTPPPAAQGLSQEEVSRIAAREKEEGRKAALAQVAADLGVDLETAKTVIAEAKKRSDSEKSEAQREREAASAEKQAAEREKAEAAKERHEARLDRAFVAAGLTDETKISRYSKLLDVAVGASPEDIKKAVDALKKDEPTLFGGATPPAPGNRPPAPGGDPQGNPPPPKQNEDAFQRGIERAKKVSGRSQYDFEVQTAP